VFGYSIDNKLTVPEVEKATAGCRRGRRMQHSAKDSSRDGIETFHEAPHAMCKTARMMSLRKITEGDPASGLGSIRSVIQVGFWPRSRVPRLGDASMSAVPSFQALAQRGARTGFGDGTGSLVS
jgi:hypothetical protein